MNKKFDTLYETYVTRYTRGGFLTGDLVRFKKGYENTAEFKSLNPDRKTYKELQSILMCLGNIFIMYFNVDLFFVLCSLKEQKRVIKTKYVETV